MHLARKLAVASICAATAICAFAAAGLWLTARPVLEETRRQSAASPVGQQCDDDLAALKIGRLRDAELSVYRAACERLDIARSCFYMTGAPRWIGYRLFRRAYASDCEVRTQQFQVSTQLGRALSELYADRPLASLTNRERTCLSAVARLSYWRACEREPACDCLETTQ